MSLHQFRSARILLLLLLPVAALTRSCVPESCYQDTISTVKAGFYETGTGLELKADSITLAGMGAVTDTVVNNLRNQKSVRFQLDPSSPGCSWLLTINGTTDTITFSYDSFTHLISKECGYSVYHTLAACTFTGNIIDTVIIRNSNITVLNEENIRIFF